MNKLENKLINKIESKWKRDKDLNFIVATEVTSLNPLKPFIQKLLNITQFANFLRQLGTNASVGERGTDTARKLYKAGTVNVLLSIKAPPHPLFPCWRVVSRTAAARVGSKYQLVIPASWFLLVSLSRSQIVSEFQPDPRLSLRLVPYSESHLHFSVALHKMCWGWGGGVGTSTQSSSTSDQSLCLTVQRVLSQCQWMAEHFLSMSGQ